LGIYRVEFQQHFLQFSFSPLIDGVSLPLHNLCGQCIFTILKKMRFFIKMLYK